MKHLIKLALVCLAAVAASLVYGFTALVAPWYIALGAAGSLVGTYIGLAFADVPAEQRDRAIYVARGAMVVEALYGFLYVLSLQSPEVFQTPLSLWLSVPLAALHGAAFSILAYFVSLFVVHERGGVAHPDPAAERDRAIVEVLERVLDRFGSHDAPAAPLPAPDVPRLIQADPEEETIEVGGKVVSLRKLADATGVPLTSLRRKVNEL